MTVRKGSTNPKLTWAAHFATILVALAAALSAAAVVCAPAGAATVLPPLTVAASTSNMTPAGTLPFVQGTVYAVTYIFTDSANAKLTNVSFSDQLPSGVTVAPGSTANAVNCGSFEPHSASGSSTISASGFTVYGNSPNKCAMEFFITASTVEGTTSDTPGTVDWTDNGTPEPSSDVSFPSWSASVVAPPTFSITYPASGATFAFNQKVRLQLSGAPSAGDSIPSGSLYAVDEVNDEVANDQLIPTDIPGRHTLTVWAQTADGYIGSGQTITYDVASPSPVDARLRGGDYITLELKYGAIGVVTATVRDGSTVVASGRQWVGAGHYTTLWARPTTAGQRILGGHKHGLEATVSLQYKQWVVKSFRPTPVATFPKIRIG